MGITLDMGSNIRHMVRRGENLVHKFAETASNKIGSIFLCQREKNESHTLSDKQEDSLVLPFKNGEQRTNI